MNTRPNQLRVSYPIDVFLYASPVYWPDARTRHAVFARVENAIAATGPSLWRFHPVDAEDKAHASAHRGAGACIVVALSGGVQPWMRHLSASRRHIALFHAYLPECLPFEISGALMHANAHPASTDFFASCRLEGKCIQWIDSLDGLVAYANAWQASQRLRHARLLKIGETEPWVINSCRDPQIISDRVGTEIVPLDRDDLYSVFQKTTDEEAREEARSWLARSGVLLDVDETDVLKACRVTAAMRRMLDTHEADGLSMACFAMIGELDTTSCLALSALNDSTSSIGACEGDLDAALTLYLLKALGADFVWIANPIIHADNAVDLAHCTAPTCACQRDLSFRLMRHHESGRGVSPEVDLPDAQTASAVRLSVNAQALCCHVGLTERQAKLPACHTQVRLHIESSQRLIDSLLGTHLVLSYGDYGMSLAFAADFLDFTLTHTQYNRTGSTHELHSHNLTGSTTDLPTQTVLAGTGRARDYGCNPHTGCVIYHRRR